jgi:hypothetical protein
VQSALLNLKEVHTRIRDLSLFSPNEHLDDISTKDLMYLTLPYVLAEVENRVRTTERTDRMGVLSQAVVRLFDHLCWLPVYATLQAHYRAFVHQLEHYEIVPEDEKKLYANKASAVVDPAKRREMKVNQYKKTKEIKDRIQARLDLPLTSPPTYLTNP